MQILVGRNTNIKSNILVYMSNLSSLLFSSLPYITSLQGISIHIHPLIKTYNWLFFCGSTYDCGKKMHLLKEKNQNPLPLVTSKLSSLNKFYLCGENMNV